jgi:hypothetical protein
MVEVEAVVKILSENSQTRSGLQVSVGRCDNSGARLARDVGAERIVLTLLEEAEESYLCSFS